MPTEWPRFQAEDLHEFVTRVFEAFKVARSDAEAGASALVHSDLLGIDSHGVARLAGHPGYVPGLRQGLINPAPDVRVVAESPATALVDGDGGLGVVVATRAMDVAIQRAKTSGAAIVTAKNSHHFGIASHYAMMALPNDMIGISMTNALPQVVPTYGKRAMLGTNPLSVAAPAGRERPFILDMATSVVAAGKVEIAERLGKPLPDGWIVDPEGRPSTNPRDLWNGGSVLPLGSSPELGSYKGYGLAVAVDVLCGVLSGAGYSSSMDPISWTTGHFFAAIRIDAFVPVPAFTLMMDQMIQALKNAERVDGADRIYVHGEKELEAEDDRRRNGIPLHPSVVDSLLGLGTELGIELKHR